ncbi:MAG: hypothetical protein J6U54_07235 [Clostridiales bacterium]|nr:hypothetical protein [Clostridiales bacterium]
MSIFKKFLKGAEKRLPEILTATGLILNGTAIVEAIRHTPQALDNLRQAEDEKGSSLDTSEKIDATWRCYVPTIVTASLGAVCIIGGAVKYRKQNAALVSLYAISEGALSEYKKKMIQELGETKVQEIESKIDKEKVEQLEEKRSKSGLTIVDPEHSTQVVIREEDLCLDTYTSRYFYTTEHDVKTVVEELNHEINKGDFVTLNDFYFKLGVDPVDFGGEVGWDTDTGLIDIFYSSIMYGGHPIMTIKFKNRPRSAHFSRYY